MIMSLLFPVLLRFTAGVLFWIFIFGVIGIMGYGIWHCYWEYDHLKRIPGSDLTVYDTGFQRDFRVCLQLRQTWGAAGGWLLGVTGHLPLPPYPAPASSPSSKWQICPSSSSAGSFKLPPTTARATQSSSWGSPPPSCSGGAGCGSSLQETGHLRLALTFATSAACNGLPLGQLLYYGGRNPQTSSSPQGGLTPDPPITPPHNGTNRGGGVLKRGFLWGQTSPR
ncbi:uncharacterized protein LOC115613324 isoform X1 [Strigops habroptila]|uniref:uncharacterized protein LOC115613324 isoform X1 n=1 Tax=Strigops habroptila TaxID=2489341 RepID=UPI0011CFE36B|nr:uncharacterized protein LOC115613324 isoform X1 [Strigops habroptila]